MQETNYGFSKLVDHSFEVAETKVREALKERGFGILTEIDPQAILKSKLNVDMQKYKILGACNPKFAHQAILAEPEIGLLLPCNVIIYEDENGAVHISAIDPASAMAMVENSKLEEIAGNVRTLLKETIASV